MSLVSWDTPKKVRTPEENDRNTFDGGPKGGYVPNMSLEDQHKWKGTIVGKNTTTPQIELRKTFSFSTKYVPGRPAIGNSASILIIVSLGGGYKYKNMTYENTKGINIHFSTNSSIQCTFDQLQEIQIVVEEAKQKLIELWKTPSNNIE